MFACSYHSQVLQAQLGCSRFMVLATAALGWLTSCRFKDAGLELTFLTLWEQRGGMYDNAAASVPKGVLMAQHNSTWSWPGSCTVGNLCLPAALVGSTSLECHFSPCLLLGVTPGTCCFFSICSRNCCCSRFWRSFLW